MLNSATAGCLATETAGVGPGPWWIHDQITVPAAAREATPPAIPTTTFQPVPSDRHDLFQPDSAGWSRLAAGSGPLTGSN
jgi:hypothetical protein